jgi:CRP/FNR family cyclic AMP-dependent transcriptional regulator
MTIAAVDFQMLANAGFLPKSFAAGAPIFEADEKGDSMFPIRSGEVEIERNGKVIETLGPGGIFGEMALKIFLFLVPETPYFAIAVMRTLADRARRMNEMT